MKLSNIRLALDEEGIEPKGINYCDPKKMGFLVHQLRRNFNNLMDEIARDDYTEEYQETNSVEYHVEMFLLNLEVLEDYCKSKESPN